MLALATHETKVEIIFIKVVLATVVAEVRMMATTTAKCVLVECIA
jgi:hypothetical protein